LTVGFALVLFVGPAADTVRADNTLSFTVNRGNLTVTVTAGSLSPEPYSATANGLATGAVTLTVDNAAVADTGWSVTMVATSFACSCGFSGVAIPAANLAIASLSDPIAIAGEDVDPNGGPIAVGAAVNADLASARKIVSADVESGNGAYSMDVGLALTVPAGSRPATYTSTVTVTASAAP
jgi:hypothetical protein